MCEETHCLIEQNGHLMGTPDCRRYALEQLSDNNRQPIMKWLEELESERLSYIEEVRVTQLSLHQVQQHRFLIDNRFCWLQLLPVNLTGLILSQRN